jgi:nucleoside 2-deoxyribosyltransferase
MNNRLRFYLASPLGFAESTKTWMNEKLLPALRQHVDIVNPWESTEVDVVSALVTEDKNTIRKMWLSIGEVNQRHIDSCHRMLAILDGVDVDSGTAAEIGYAYAKGMSVSALRTDLRQSGELYMNVNLQVEYFIEASGGKVFRTLDECVDDVRILQDWYALIP